MFDLYKMQSEHYHLHCEGMGKVHSKTSDQNNCNVLLDTKLHPYPLIKVQLKPSTLFKTALAAVIVRTPSETV